MSVLPMLTARRLIRALEKAGFEVQRQTGSHVRLRHPDGRVVTVPVYGSQDIGHGLQGMSAVGDATFPRSAGHGKILREYIWQTGKRDGGKK